jgi:hypothetical protein
LTRLSREDPTVPREQVAVAAPRMSRSPWDFAAAVL